jgi:hippurate hydrolase
LSAWLVPPVAWADKTDQAPAKLKELAPSIKEQVNQQYEQLLAFYKDLHIHPELSLQEERTSAKLAQEMGKIPGFEVTSHVGGYGIVCVLKNGSGPTVLVRTDMDALPVTEHTNLPYASHAVGRDRAGNQTGVMHACGHDMHMTCWLGTAQVLAALKDRWHGTLVFIGQPAEEVVMGARKMLDDGLFERFPKPDYCLALHCSPRVPHGHVAWAPGPIASNSDTVDIIVRGKGGHGAAPHTTVDPIVLAARIVLDLQTIVSRETNPADPVVITVGAIHGGTKHNIIPVEVKLLVTVRTMKDSVRKHTLDAIKRKVYAAAQGAAAPEPVVQVSPDELTPALINDEKLARQTAAAFKEVLGPENVEPSEPNMGSEDFSRYHQQGIPIFMFQLGTLPPEQVAEGKREGGTPLPSLHSDLYYPIPDPSMKTGILAMSTAILNLVGK